MAASPGTAVIGTDASIVSATDAVTVAGGLRTFPALHLPLGDWRIEVRPEYE